MLFLSGALLLGRMIAVVDHFNVDRFENFHVIPGAIDTRSSACRRRRWQRCWRRVRCRSTRPASTACSRCPILARRQRQAFASVDDLRRVRFIGAATVKRLRPFVSTD
ncbi:MAG: hypothetical protein VCE12_22300 [Candidatus Latescibacterota bacterium]